MADTNTKVEIDLTDTAIPEAATTVSDVLDALTIEELNEAITYCTRERAEKVQAKAREVRMAFLMLAQDMGLNEKEAIGAIAATGGVVRGTGSLPAKYIGPTGETWSGRGATPKWLLELMEQGRKREEFLVS